jgi:hypothetical protein
MPQAPFRACTPGVLGVRLRAPGAPLRRLCAGRGGATPTAPNVSPPPRRQRRRERKRSHPAELGLAGPRTFRAALRPSTRA